MCVARAPFLFIAEVGDRLARNTIIITKNIEKAPTALQSKLQVLKKKKKTERTSGGFGRNPNSI
jgi:hypothetical protein